MQKRLKNYYIAYFDILGYKDFLEENETDIIEFLEANISIAKEVVCKTNEIVSKFNFIIKSFSDNYIILLEDNCQNDGYQEVIALSYLVAIFQLRFLEKYSILIRGCITKGKAFIDSNIVFGDGLIRAVSMEHYAKFPRIIIDKERIDNKVCEDLCEKCISLDEDNEYYVNFFEIIGMVIFSEEFFSENISELLNRIKHNIESLVTKYCKYPKDINDINKLQKSQKLISKYVWLLSKFNRYCEIYEPEYYIKHLFVLNERTMNCEIEVKK